MASKSSSFAITNQKEMLRNLNLLLKNKSLLTAHFGDHNESFITTILQIDTKDNLLLLDYGPKEYLNRMLLDSRNVVFKTEYRGIKVDLPGEKLAKSQLGGQTALSMPLPRQLIWRQRRGFYRVKSPLSGAAHCQLTLNEDQDVDLKLFDISLSGLSLLNDEKTISNQLIPTAKFENCRLILPEAGEGTVSFIIRNKHPANPEKPNHGQRLGCEFTALEPAFESTIQRYMQRIELQNRKKS